MILEWKLYKGKTTCNHLILISAQKPKAVCNSYFLDTYPSPKWTVFNNEYGQCAKCKKTEAQNKRVVNNPGRETHKINKF